MADFRDNERANRRPRHAATHERPRPGRSHGSTRERILDIALDLFNEQGYDKTSLREIADKLGFTKAALYYHFPSKEDILLSLHLQLHALGHEVMARLRELDEGKENLETWAALLDHYVDQIASNRRLFLLHERNQNALEQIGRSKAHEAEHEDLEEELRRYLRSPAIPLADRVRMAASFGVVTGVFMMSGDTFAEVPTATLIEHVRLAVADLLRSAPARPAPSTGRRGPRPARPRHR